VIERGLIMDNQIKVKNYTKSYVIWTYAVFWIGILIAAGLYLLSNSELVMSLSTIPLSWIPTIVLFVMFNKLISNASRKEWLKENFKTKVNIKLVLITTLIFVLSIVLTYLIMICFNDAVLSLKEATVSFGGVVIEIIVCIITGATGEELGWRGYLQRHFEEKENGDVLNEDIPIIEIIKEVVHTYAKEPYHNIIINDIDEFGLTLLDYRGEEDLYVYGEKGDFILNGNNNSIAFGE
jgi:hypothetical protein